MENKPTVAEQVVMPAELEETFTAPREVLPTDYVDRQIKAQNHTGVALPSPGLHIEYSSTAEQFHTDTRSHSPPASNSSLEDIELDEYPNTGDPAAPDWLTNSRTSLIQNPIQSVSQEDFELLARVDVANRHVSVPENTRQIISQEEFELLTQVARRIGGYEPNWQDRYQIETQQQRQTRLQHQEQKRQRSKERRQREKQQKEAIKAMSIWYTAKPSFASAAYALIIANAWGTAFCMPIYMEYYFNSILKGTSLYLIALIGCLNVACMFFAAYPIGRIWRPGVLKPLLWPGAILAIAAQFMLVLCPNWWSILLIQALLQGFALGTCLVIGTLALSTYYKNDLGRTSTMLSPLGPVGAIIYTSVLYSLLAKDHFEAAVCIIGSLMTLSLGLACAILRSNARREPLTPQRWHGQTMFTEASHLPFLGGQILGITALLTFHLYLVLFGTNSLGIPPQKATTLLFYTLTTQVLGRALADFLSARIGLVNTMIIGYLGSGCTLVTLAASLRWVQTSHASAFLIAGLLVLGFFSGLILHYFMKVVAHMNWTGRYQNPDDPLRMLVHVCLYGLSVLGGGMLGASLLVRGRGNGFVDSWYVEGLALFAAGLLLLWAKGLKLGWGWQAY